MAEKFGVCLCGVEIINPATSDKAGAYAIQGGCMPYIRGIQGEYATVVGFPAARFYQELLKKGVDLRKTEEEEYYEL